MSIWCGVISLLLTLEESCHWFLQTCWKGTWHPLTPAFSLSNQLMIRSAAQLISLWEKCSLSLRGKSSKHSLSLWGKNWQELAELIPVWEELGRNDAFQDGTVSRACRLCSMTMQNWQSSRMHEQENASQHSDARTLSARKEPSVQYKIGWGGAAAWQQSRTQSACICETATLP